MRGKDGEFTRARKGAIADVCKDDVFVPTNSGAMCALSGYFTKPSVVNDLTANVLQPKIDEHLARLDDMSDSDASSAFFDFYVMDPCAGSGHIMICAIRLVARAMAKYLESRPLADVENEILGMRAAAEKNLADVGQRADIDDHRLLCRLVALRCVFGVDINPRAVELAKLNIQITRLFPACQ